MNNEITIDKAIYDYMESMDVLRLHFLSIREELKDMPDGSLVKKQIKGHDYFYHFVGRGKRRSQKYLSANKDSALIQALIKKQIEQKGLKESLSTLKRLFLNSGSFIIDYYNAIKSCGNTSFPVFQSEKKAYRNGLKYQTAHGETVRSKSEVLICNSLLSLGIPYAYEKRLEVCGDDFCPDFTIKHPLNGDTVYLEHLGLNDNEYSNTWNYKKRAYASNGIVEGKNLYITHEDDIPNINQKLAKFFTYRRYDDLISFISSLYQTG